MQTRNAEMNPLTSNTGFQWSVKVFETFFVLQLKRTLFFLESLRLSNHIIAIEENIFFGIIASNGDWIQLFN